MSPNESQQKIQEMVRRIVEHFHPEKIVLFGSYARGTAGPDSDVDLLVIMPISMPKRELRIQIRMQLHGLGISKDIVVATPEEFEAYRDIAGTIVRAAHLEGKTLYDHAA
jgi:predicted nucleotidyltransferase